VDVVSELKTTGPIEFTGVNADRMLNADVLAELTPSAFFGVHGGDPVRHHRRMVVIHHRH
jgi:hypothetical protein